MKFSENVPLEDCSSINIIYRKLLDLAPDLLFKLVWKDGNYTLAFVNGAINQIYELTVEQMINDQGILLRERVLPKYHNLMRDTLQASRETLSKWDFEFEVSLPKQGLKWVRVIATPELCADGSICFYGRVCDITAQKVQEEKLQISEERFKFAIEAAGEGIWDWDMVNNTTYFSGHAMKILVRDEGDVTVSSDFWRSRIHPDDVKAREAAKRKGLRKDATYESIYRVRTEEGKYRWVLSRGRAVEFDKNGKPTRAIGVHKDITQFKQKELDLANTINIIGNQNNRLHNFAHIVSHNLRSHAGNLKMLLDLFKSAKKEEREEMLPHLEAISDGLTITISHLKDLVEIQTELKNEKTKLNLRHYLKNILNILHNEIKKHGVNIEINIPLDVTVTYNPAYLESILLNFTTNAIKYSSSDRQPMLSYDYEIIDGYKVLSISDNGLGIDLKKHKNSLFGMYKTFHKNQNSRGIGLFITKNQVEAMGGRIEVYSEPDKGTTFKVFFNEEE